jgi:hypothetical protein
VIASFDRIVRTIGSINLYHIPYLERRNSTNFPLFCILAQSQLQTIVVRAWNVIAVDCSNRIPQSTTIQNQEKMLNFDQNPFKISASSTTSAL